MTSVWTFLGRTHGRDRMSWVDWLTYAYLLFGFLLIFLPVCWLVLNSFKIQAPLEKQDLSLLPDEFTQVARATVYGPDGRDILILDELPGAALARDERCRTHHL